MDRDKWQEWVLTAMVLVLIMSVALAAVALASCAHEPAATPTATAAPESANSGYGVMQREQWTVDVTGAAGSGTGDEYAAGGGVEGRIYAVYLDYTSGISTTTDVTISVSQSPTQTIFTKADSRTDGWFYPGVQLTGADGSAISGAYQAFPVAGAVRAQVAQSSTGTLTITLLWGE